MRGWWRGVGWGMGAQPLAQGLKQKQLKDYTTIRLPVLQLPSLSHWSRHLVDGVGGVGIHQNNCTTEEI